MKLKCVTDINGCAKNENIILKNLRSATIPPENVTILLVIPLSSPFVPEHEHTCIKAKKTILIIELHQLDVS